MFHVRVHQRGDSAGMLNQKPERRIAVSNDWCVGEPSARWDVPFGNQLVAQLRRWLSLGTQDAERRDAVRRERTAVRNAA